MYAISRRNSSGCQRDRRPRPSRCFRRSRRCSLQGTAYAAAATIKAIDKRSSLVERQWDSRALLDSARDRRRYELTPCLEPLAPVRDYVHVLSGIDNVAARLDGQGNGHFSALCGLMTGTAYTGRGAAGASIDQILAAKIGTKSRFRSLQVGVAQESHGENVHRNMTWAGYERALPPEMIPHNLFDRLFGVKDQSWVDRKKSVLDLVTDDVSALQPALGSADRQRLDQHLTSIRDLERAIASLPPDYGKNIRSRKTSAISRTIPRSRRSSPISSSMRLPRPNERRRLHAHEVPEPDAVPMARTPDNRHHDYTHTNAVRRSSSASCATLRGGTSNSSPTSAGLKRFPKVRATCSTTRRACSCTSMQSEPAQVQRPCDARRRGGIKGGQHTKTHTDRRRVLTITEELLKRARQGFPTAEEKMAFLV